MSEAQVYRKNRHACYDLEYHLVVVTGYRHPVLTGDIEKRLKEISIRLLNQNWGCDLESIECERDHAHILFSAPPQVCLSELINNYKTVTSRLLRKEFPDMAAKYYWGGSFWSKSYFIGSVSDRTKDVVAAYIRDQKTHGQSRTVQKLRK